MKKIFCLAILACSASTLQAQTILRKDPEIQQMVNAIRTDSLESIIHTLVGFGTRHTLSNTRDSQRGIGAARNWVISRFQSYASHSGGRMTVELDKWTQSPDGKRVDIAADMGNAMAILHGTDTADKRIYIISGHLDSRASDVMNRNSDAPGANDDASGVAAVLECARVMSQYAFPSTLIFVAVCGEEQGLLGSEHLAARALSEQWDVCAMLNNDIIGGNNSNETGSAGNEKVRVFSEGLPAAGLEKKAAMIRQYGLENDGASRQLARYMKETGERYVENLNVMMIYRNDRFLRGGDHIPFVEKGFPAIRVTELNENYDHQHQDVRMENHRQYGDLPEFMDFEYLRKNTALNLSTLANLAKSPPPPREVKMGVRSLNNRTQLNWLPPSGSKPAGYYILMRETTASQWQRKFFTSQTEMNLPYSMDNYFFAVQSAGPEGNESLPVIPAISRQ